MRLSYRAVITVVQCGQYNVKPNVKSMDRASFRKLFKTPGPAILPVIHTLDVGQAAANIRIAIREGAQGVFLINHDFEHERLLPILREVRDAFPWLWLGVNFLGVTGARAFPVLGDLQRDGCVIDAYWADDARIDERVDVQTEAQEIDRVRDASGWHGLYFGGTAFKKQREVAPEHFDRAATLACDHMDVVTTSGVATGQAADLGKIRTFRTACGDHPTAIASGVTPDNIAQYAPLLDAILIATGINRPNDFYNIEPERLRMVVRRARSIGLGEE